jgi:hypothetical protein
MNLRETVRVLPQTREQAWDRHPMGNERRSPAIFDLSPADIQVMAEGLFHGLRLTVSEDHVIKV